MAHHILLCKLRHARQSNTRCCGAHLPLTLKARPPSAVSAAATVCASPPRPSSCTLTSHTCVSTTRKVAAACLHNAGGHGQVRRQCRQTALLPILHRWPHYPAPTSDESLLASSVNEATPKDRVGAAKAKRTASKREDLPHPFGPAVAVEAGAAAERVGAASLSRGLQAQPLVFAALSGALLME